MVVTGDVFLPYFYLFLPTHVFLPTILESFSEKYEEKISGLSYTANINRKSVDSNGISRIECFVFIGWPKNGENTLAPPVRFAYCRT